MILSIISKINFYLEPFIFVSTGAIFILFFIFGIMSWKNIFDFFKKIKRKTIIILVLIFLIGLSLRFFVISHQLIMVEDELNYIITAKSLLSHFFTTRHEKAPGWAFLLAVAFKLFGIKINTALFLSSTLGSLTIPGIFFITLLLSKKEEISLYSALIFSILPLHVVWSGSAETNVSSLFFLITGIFFCLLYFQNRNSHILFRLSLYGLAFLSLFRPENYLVFLIFLICFLIFDFRRLRDYNFILPLVGIIILITPCLFSAMDYYFNFFPDKLGAWSIGNIIYNSRSLGEYFFNTRIHPYIFLILCPLGMIIAFFKNKKTFLFLIAWVAIFYLAYFSSWVGKDAMSGKTRVFLNFYPPMTIFCGYFFYFVGESFKNKKKRKLVISILLLAVLSFFYMSYKENNGKYLTGTSYLLGKAETEIIKIAERKIPKDCLVVANFPRVLATAGLKTISVDYWNEKKDSFIGISCVLFLKDYTCNDVRGLFNLGNFPNAKEVDCEKIKEDANVYISITSGKDYPMGFYKKN